MIDPAAVLGVSADASDEEVRAAYLAKVREHPPERAPEEFERIRDAYELLRDPRRRLRQRLFAVDPRTPLSSVFAEHTSGRSFVGPEAWLNVLKGR